MTKVEHPIAQLAINTIRTLAMDAVEKADSGHPGTPMALAPVGYTLWQDFLNYDPDDPRWANRDRFVLSVGHASMLLYALLHLTGVKAADPDYEKMGEPAVSLDDIKRFRQLSSHCPGHPEYHIVSGVETTTGPLGQGVANSVGMAIAQRWLATHFNRPGYDIFDYRIYVMCSDGDLMEGIGSEAASLAGHLQLSRLCWIYDNNHISIDGSTDLTFTEDVEGRFEAYGWKVHRVSDANDLLAIHQALQFFLRESDRPTLIVVDSHIGYGAPHKQDTAAAHGSPLGAEEVRLTKRYYGWPEDSSFLIPDGVKEHFAAGMGRRGRGRHAEWRAMWEGYEKDYPDLAKRWRLMQDRALPEGWDEGLSHFPPDAKGMASRESSSKVLNRLAQNIPWILGGSADLASSTKTTLTFPGAGDQSVEEPGGRNIHFGVREHIMGAAINGLSLSHLRPYGSTFLIFSDYEKPAIRLSAIMELPVVHIFTHDSIGVGEDGPTHQPIEQLTALRATPGLITLRPCDANEVVEAWRLIMSLTHQPVALCLTRQAIPTLDRQRFAPASGLAKGAYILAESRQGEPELILIATGSEVSLAVTAYEELNKEGIRTRVVSMPSWELFEQQSQAYQQQVLPPAIKARISIEQASTFGWQRYVGSEGLSIGMHTYGASAPLKDLLTKFGFTKDDVVKAARRLVRASLT